MSWNRTVASAQLSHVDSSKNRACFHSATPIAQARFSLGPGFILMAATLMQVKSEQSWSFFC